MPQQPESTSLTSYPAHLSAATVGAVPTIAFWWQWPWRSADRAPPLKGSVRPRARSRKRNSSRRKLDRATCRASSVRTSSTHSSRRVRRQEGSRPTMATPRATQGARRSMLKRACSRASSSIPLEMRGRPQHFRSTSSTR